MIDCNIIATLGEVLLVAALIGSVVCILIAIRCGSEYICKRHDRDSESLHQLRKESDLQNGISQNNLLYRFFFR